MTRRARNTDKHTDANLAKRRILKRFGSHDVSPSRGLLKSELGYAAFPDYSFRAEQGAAFSVAKLTRDLEKEGLIRFGGKGYHLTARGLLAIKVKSKFSDEKTSTEISDV